MSLEMRQKYIFISFCLEDVRPLFTPVSLVKHIYNQQHFIITPILYFYFKQITFDHDMNLACLSYSFQFKVTFKNTHNRKLSQYLII